MLAYIPLYLTIYSEYISTAYRIDTTMKNNRLSYSLAAMTVGIFFILILNYMIYQYNK